MLYRELAFDASAANVEGIPVVLSTEHPVDRGHYVEVLSHHPADVDLSRSPLPLIESHDHTRLNIGVVDKLKFDGRRLRGVARFGKSSRATEVAHDVLDGIIRSVSVGYELLDAGLPQADGSMRFKWRPLEVSAVSVPADPNAGFYRSGEKVMSNAYAPLLGKPKEPKFKLDRALSSVICGELDKQSREALEEMGYAAGPHRFTIPFSVLAKRDLSASVANAGGYLVETEIHEVANALRPVSSVIAAGAKISSGLSGNLSLPKVTASASAYFLSNEQSTVAESQPSLGAISFTPKTVGAYLEFSRQISIQSALFQSTIEEDLRKIIGSAIDQAALNGTGASGQPTGILNTSGIQTVSGASLSWSGVVGMTRRARAANASESSLAWIADPITAEILEARERAAGNGFVFDNGLCNNRPYVCSTNVPSNVLVLGDFSQVVLGIWGSGIEIEVNPYASFQTGGQGARLLVSFDFGLRFPTTFVVAANLS